MNLCDANSIAHLFEKRKAFCANKKARRSIRRAACSVKNIRLLMHRGRAASPVIPSPARDLYGAIVSVSFRPSVSERRNLWQNSARVLYSLFDNTDCILPSRGGVKTRSKARAVLPCLQGVKRARRNRRHMGASPWQFVAESVSFLPPITSRRLCRHFTQGYTVENILNNLLRVPKPRLWKSALNLPKTFGF